MPATKSKKRKKAKVPSSTKKPAQFKLATSASLAIAAISGAILGLSAPGIDQWYVAWFGLVPLLLLCVSSLGIKDAFLRGVVFGTAYNLVYLNWYLKLHPLGWMGFNDLESCLVAAAAWIIVSLHQGLIVGIVAALIRWLPLTGGFVPRTVDNRFCLPAPLVIPVLWALIGNKVCNAPDALGVPWTMLEYSQYKFLPIVQVASWIGGIGLGALIVLFNTLTAQLVSTLSQRLALKPLAVETTSSALVQYLSACLCIAALTAWGFSRLASPTPGSTTALSVVQGNINIEMQKRTKSYTLTQLADHYRSLIGKMPSGLCIWTESALPTYLKDEPSLLAQLSTISREGQHDMVIGSLDKDYDGRPFNSAFGIDSTGHLAEAVYHKRYLVPFGEYMPGFVHLLPDWIQRLTSTPAGTGFNAGKMPVVLNLSGHAVAPLICFETLSPELVVTSVRNGGTLLVNLSDLAWFHDSICGDQMVAFSVLRAVENGRYFVFAANTGPSVIIDNHGKMLARSKQDQPTILPGRVRFERELTPFTQWFH